LTAEKKQELARKFLSVLGHPDAEVVKSIAVEDVVWSFPGASPISGEVHGVRCGPGERLNRLCPRTTAATAVQRQSRSRGAGNARRHRRPPKQYVGLTRPVCSQRAIGPGHDEIPVEDPKDLCGTLDEAMNYRGPALVNVRISQDSARKPQKFR
jgi:hypothetical protein